MGLAKRVRAEKRAAQVVRGERCVVHGAAHRLGPAELPQNVVALPSAWGAPDLGRSELEEELRTLRYELQHTMEAYEATNEELKASNEEVTSINEELQSANEELETGKLYFHGQTNAAGVVRGLCKFPVDVTTCDVLVTSPAHTGPYTFESHRDFWGATAPSARVQFPVTSQLNATLVVEARQ